MSFADAYLRKAGLREALIGPEPHPGLDIIVTIPVLNESGLERCLDSLFLSASGSDLSMQKEDAGSSFRAIQTEVLILINAPAEAPAGILEQNRDTLESTRAWIETHPHPSIAFHVWLDHSFGKKEAGVGMARKILMDEAVRRFSLLDRPDGIIASMDADAVVQSNYLEALVKHFRAESPGVGAEDPAGPGSLVGGGAGLGSLVGGGPDGCSIRFEHPLADGDPQDLEDGRSHSPVVYRAIIQYELHLRYYLQAVRHTGYPYAYHTVGSSFAVRADIYCKEGGMNRRQGGEDFYFIQKVAQRGNFSQCNATCVFPSPRPSDRVPFGTGPVVSRLSSGDAPLLSYDPRPFGMLKEFFAGIRTGSFAGEAAEPLQSFLENQDFAEALKEMQANSASAQAFMKRFWRWFNMFRIMKFLHWSRERGYPDIPVGKAAAQLLRLIDPESKGIPSVGTDPKKLLLIFRMLDLR